MKLRNARLHAYHVAVLIVVHGAAVSPKQGRCSRSGATPTPRHDMPPLTPISGTRYSRPRTRDRISTVPPHELANAGARTAEIEQSGYDVLTRLKQAAPQSR